MRRRIAAVLAALAAAVMAITLAAQGPDGASGPLPPPLRGLTQGSGRVDVFVGGTPTAAPSVTCDSSVTTRTALAAATADSANAGKTVCVTADITGATISITTDFATQARFIAQPADGTVDMVPISFSGAHKVTFEAFDFPGPTDTDSFTVVGSAESQSVWMLKNHIHDHFGNGLILKFDTGVNTTSDIRFMGNLLECISSGGTADHGYGVRTFAGTSVRVQNSKFSYNTIDGCGASADGMELGDLNNSEVCNNVIHDVRWNGVGTDPHADAIMLWDDGTSNMVCNNRLYSNADALNSPDSTSSWTNNLIVNHNGGNSCLDSHQNGSSGNIWASGHTYQQNTIMVCGATGIIMDTGATGGTNNVLDRNLLDGMSCPPNGNAAFATKDHNLFLGSNPCSLTGTNTFSFSPSWANTTDPTSSSYYIATNLPGGYTDAGYSYVPAGHTACTC